MRIHILTAVWGAAYVERFARFTLRSLMAPGNLLDLARDYDVSYHLYSSPADIERIKHTAAFGKLSDVVDVHFHPFALGDIDAHNAMSHWDVWQWGVAEARQADACVILVAADQVFCRNTFVRWIGLLRDGKLAVFCTGFQVVVETFADEIASRFHDDQPIDLTLPAMREIIFRHLHPIIISMFRDSPRAIPHPEWDLRALPGQGVMHRALAAHAYAFYPSRIAMTENFCPTEKFDRVVFEPSCFLGAEPMFKQLGLYLRPWRMDDTALSYYGVWAEKFMAEANLRESRIAHPMPFEVALPGARIRNREPGGAFYVGQMQASRAIVRLLRALQAAGLYQGARWLAAAHLQGRLRRRLPVKGAITVFVPADAVLERVTAEAILRLLAGHGAELVATIRAHSSLGRHELAPGDRIGPVADGPIGMLDGRRYGVNRAGPIALLQGPIRSDDTCIYVIDRLMTPLALQGEPQAGVLALLRHRLRHTARQWALRGRAAVLGRLQRHRGAYQLALALREHLVEQWQRRSAGKASVAVGTVSPRALSLYRRALALHGLEATRELFDFYGERVLAGSPIASVPRDLLGQLGAIDTAATEQWLAEASAESPTFSEAWLELGFVRKEARDLSGALDAFDRAASLPAVLLHPLGQPDMRAIAATEKALLLEARGLHAEALAALEATPVKRFASWQYDLIRARLLLKTGRAEEVLAAFEQCLSWRSVSPQLTALLPQELQDIQQAQRDGGR